MPQAIKSLMGKFKEYLTWSASQYVLSAELYLLLWQGFNEALAASRREAEGEVLSDELCLALCQGYDEALAASEKAMADNAVQRQSEQGAEIEASPEVHLDVQDDGEQPAP